MPAGNLSRPDPGRTEKINLSFYFHTSLWYLKRFYGTFLRHHEEVRKWKFILIYLIFILKLSEIHGAGRVKLYKDAIR